ncbi:pimeloyl-ACP methyl ester carboxylesterase [Crossiella equi]|uniref:Pimeloyl-ACP methyl ester carboxylesterase n=1 Tax=Crossiella equi TaxID=130796 RepID=A0ABS5AP17_9PSEU|nr:alpha/beta hydrolase [Crossiella equi]MBP2478306.1 pimeloyl-ACP methyl ester carboxylesterase [Crossiella equi]
MRSTTRTLGALAVSAALALPTAGTAGADEESAPRPIEWTTCFATEKSECGYLKLPVDWRKPDGEQLTVGFARRRAAKPEQRIGTLFVNPGGPWSSASNMALWGEFSQEVLDRFDLIGMDPRGSGLGSTGFCDRDLLVDRPSPYPASEAGFTKLVNHNRALWADCRERSGALWDHLGTDSVVRDLDAVRAALGERRISFYGVSYGTLLGQQYARRYGHRLRALALDSVMDHSLDDNAFAVTEAWAAEDSFREWVKWCDRTASCALHGQDVAAVWDGVLRRADPAQVPAIVERALNAFYDPDWAGLAEHVRRLATDPAAARAAGPPQPSLRNHFEDVFCADWGTDVRTKRDLDRITEAERRIAPHMRTSPLGRKGIARCVGAPVPTNPQRPARFGAAPTALVLNARHDPATPYPWALNLARQAGKAVRLLTYDGWGHGVYHRGACTTAALDGYLLHGRLPAEGARCAAVEPGPGTRRSPASGPGFSVSS